MKPVSDEEIEWLEALIFHVQSLPAFDGSLDRGLWPHESAFV